MSRFREREDEARRDYYEWDEPLETYDDYLQRTTQPEARLSERSRAGTPLGSPASRAARPGTGRSENREEAA